MILVIVWSEIPDYSVPFCGRHIKLEEQSYQCKPLKCQTKIAADDILIFYFYLLKKLRLDFSCESSAKQRIHMKYQVLFSLKQNEKVFMNVVCYSRDWCFKG